MIKMAGALFPLERKRLQKKTEEAKKAGRVSALLFLEEEMNALEGADCFFFYGSRWFPKALLTVFFPDEEHGEITVAEFKETKSGLTELFRCAIDTCRRAGVEKLYTVRNPENGFSFEKIAGISFVCEWTEFLLCAETEMLAGLKTGRDSGEIRVQKELAEEQDGTFRYCLTVNGTEAAECRILSPEEGRQCYLFGLKTKEAFRRQGLATRLIREIAGEYAKVPGMRMCLQVSSKNEPAERLYRKLGFRTEEWREYYKTEEC